MLKLGLKQVSDPAKFNGSKPDPDPALWYSHIHMYTVYCIVYSTWLLVEDVPGVVVMFVPVVPLSTCINLAILASTV